MYKRQVYSLYRDEVVAAEITQGLDDGASLYVDVVQTECSGDDTIVVLTESSELPSSVINNESINSSTSLVQCTVGQCLGCLVPVSDCAPSVRLCDSTVLEVSEARVTPACHDVFELQPHAVSCEFKPSVISGVDATL